MGWLAPTIGISIITLASMGYALYWALAPDGYWGLILCAGVVVVASIVMMFVMPQARTAHGLRVQGPRPEGGPPCG